VYATNDQSSFAATQTIAVPAATTAPAMVSWIVTPGLNGTVTVTYNEAVTCPSGAGNTAYQQFTYYYTGVASSAPFASCSTSGSVLTLAVATGATVHAPGTGPSITYTAPSTNSTTASVYATGSSSPVLYAATQTLASSAMTAPSMSAATVTAGTSGTIAVTYTDATTPAMACPATQGDVQAEFVYSNGGSPAYPTTCSASTDTITLGAFMTSSTGTTAANLVLPGGSDTLT
jgi:hypothetical protein